MSIKVILFSQDLIALNEEIANHPELQRRMTEMIANDPQMAGFEEKMAMICSYVGINVDSWLGKDGINELASLCTDKLRGKRSILILPASSTSH